MTDADFAKMMLFLVVVGLFIIAVLACWAFALGDILFSPHAMPWVP